MKIYTKTGDDGETGLFGGPRVFKDDPRVDAYGTVDELSSAIGIAKSYASDVPTTELLHEIQNELFSVGAELATPEVAKRKSAVSASSVTRLEQSIDRMEEDLAPLEHFVLPGGCPAAAHVHLARAICRRAERRIVKLGRDAELTDNVLPFFNRLSDALFVLARYQNHLAGVDDTTWQPL